MSASTRVTAFPFLLVSLRPLLFPIRSLLLCASTKRCLVLYQTSNALRYVTAPLCVAVPSRKLSMMSSTVVPVKQSLVVLLVSPVLANHRLYLPDSFDCPCALSSTPTVLCLCSYLYLPVTFHCVLIWCPCSCPASLNSHPDCASIISVPLIYHPEGHQHCTSLSLSYLILFYPVKPNPQVLSVPVLSCRILFGSVPS
jgi:hypothetical protein